MSIHPLLTPFILVPLMGVFLLLLGLVFDGIKPCVKYAPLCRLLCLGIVLGCVAGVAGEIVYDFIERWLFRNVPIPALLSIVDGIFDHGYPRILGTLSGAAAAIWFWCAHRETFPDTR